jgi:5-(carboxyamino)imidazole ribonucleotide mutase
MLSVDHADVAAALAEFRKRQTDDVASNDDPRR